MKTILLSIIPLGRMGSPDEVAKAVSFVFSCCYSPRLSVYLLTKSYQLTVNSLHTVSTHPGSTRKDDCKRQCLVGRMAQLDDQGKLTDAQAALSKAFATAKCLQTVAWGNGGNGISIDYNI